MVLGTRSEGFVSNNGSVTQVQVDPTLKALNKVAESFLGKTTEPFVTSVNGTPQVNTSSIAQVGGMIALYSILAIAFIIVFCYGAARTSYCYNIAIGNTADVAFLFSIVCFFFPNFYYPFYAIFLNPLCTKMRNNKSMFGGKK